MVVVKNLEWLVHMNSVTLKQRTDGQIQVTSVRVDKKFYDENPQIKQDLKNRMEYILEANNVRVLKDVGIVEWD